MKTTEITAVKFCKDISLCGTLKGARPHSATDHNRVALIRNSSLSKCKINGVPDNVRPPTEAKTSPQGSGIY